MTHRSMTMTLFLLGLAVLVGVRPADGQQPDKDAKKQPAYLKVTVPADNMWAADKFPTQLKIDNSVTKQTGTVRNFVSPPLEVGKKYSYTLTVVFTINNYTKYTRKKEVTVEAGKTTEVDLTTPDENFKDDIEVRYVPTPQAVVDKMLELAEVKPGDIVWDLGSGDGRIPITAVEKFKAKRGLGLEINPDLIKRATASAKEHGVDDKVEFRAGDVLKIDDYSEANVVTLYMGEKLNLAVRPALQKSLKPGSRVVSHRFTMGDWKPEKTITMEVDGEKYLIHLWRIGEAKGDKEDKKEEKKEDK